MVKVSFIVPTYNNGAKCYKRAYKSIRAQTISDYEIIVVDDCSQDGTRAIFSKLKGVVYLRMAVNGGKSKAVNRALKKSTGEFIVIVDDDNELHPTFLQETMGAIERESARELARDNESYMAVTTGRMVRHLGYDDYAPAYFQSGLGFTAIDWGWLIRKKAFDQIKYDESLYGDEDADFGIQFFKRFRAYPLDKPLQTAYAYGGESVCYPTEKRLSSLLRFYNKNYLEYMDAGPKDISFLNRFMARNLYLAGRKKDAIGYFWKAFKEWKTGRTLVHFLVSLISYRTYYYLMRIEEKYYSKKRLKNYGL